MLSDVSQAQIDRSCTIFHLPAVPRIGEFIETESSIRLPGIGRGLGSGIMGMFNGYRTSVCDDEEVLEMDGDDDCTLM